MAGPTVSLTVRLVDQLSGIAGAVVRGVQNIGRSFGGLGRAAGAAAPNVDALLGRLANVSLAAGGVSRVAESIGRSLGTTVKTTAEFDDVLQGIAQTGGLTAERVRQIRAEILALAPVFGRRPDAIAGLFGDLVASGLSDDVAGNVLRPLGRVAVGARTALGDVGSTAIALLKNLGIPLEQIESTFDGLSTAGKLGRFELKDMAQHFASVAAMAANAGMKGREAAVELAAALQITRDAAGTPGEAANNLRNVLQKLQSPETVKKFKEHGVDIKEAIANGLKEGRSPLETVIRETKKLLDSDTKLTIGDLFADSQVQGALGPLVRNFEQFLKIREEAGKASGVIEKDFSAMSETTKAAFDQLDAAGDSLAKTWGDLMAPAARKLAEAVQALADGLRNLMTEHPVLGKIAAYGLGGFALVAMGIANISTAVLSLVGALALFRMIGGGALLAGLGRLFLGGLGLLLLPLRLLGIFAAALGSGLVSGLAGAGLFAALATLRARFMVWLAGLAVRGAIIAAVVGGKIGAAFSAAMALAAAAGGWLVRAVTAGSAAAIAAAAALGTRIGAALSAAIAVASTAGAAFAGLATRLVAAVGVALAALATPVGWAAILLGIGAALAAYFWDDIVKAFDSATDWVMQISEKIAAALRSIDLAGAASAIMDSLLAGLRSAAAAVEAWAVGWINKIKSLFSFTASPTIAPRVAPAPAVPQPGDPSFVPMRAPGGSAPASTSRQASLTFNNTFNVTGADDAERAARRILAALDRQRQAGLYDGALA